MTRYFKVQAEAGKFARSYIPKHVGGVHKLACCDCGLVHDVKFSAWLKVIKKGKLVGYQKLSRRASVVMIEVGRNERATAAKRRKKQLCVKQK